MRVAWWASFLNRGALTRTSRKTGRTNRNSVPLSHVSHMPPRIPCGSLRRCVNLRRTLLCAAASSHLVLHKDQSRSLLGQLRGRALRAALILNFSCLVQQPCLTQPPSPNLILWYRSCTRPLESRSAASLSTKSESCSMRSTTLNTVSLLCSSPAPTERDRQRATPRHDPE